MDDARIGRPLSRCRCKDCRALLFKASDNCLRPAAVIEVKCGKCNAMNYWRGTPLEARSSTEAVTA